MLSQIRGTSKGEAIDFQARETGIPVEYKEPDSKAEAIYSYLDATGQKVLKQVLKCRDKDGNKTFRQRRPVGGTWKWDVSGVKPSLYNLQYLRDSQTVILCEGEKDCDRLMEFELYGNMQDKIVAMTSGGANSWKDELADKLVGKRVVIMPDADDAGVDYQAEIEDSLEKREIEYTVVYFDNNGVKDVSEFLDSGHRIEELLSKIPDKWVMTLEQYHQWLIDMV